MKWYFACNEKSPDFFPLIKGAVNSVLKNTDLEPIFIYDGKENELTEWLEDRGVKIIRHRVSFYDKLQAHGDEKYLSVASGAFLRCDIPIIETEDEIVLYTDCDVLFLKNFDTKIKPKYFACSAQTNKLNFTAFNTGVMLMNVKTLRESHTEFIKFITENLCNLPTFDQSAYQKFYKHKNTKLPVRFNHKPYWGVDKNAVILHFHGCKPTTFASDVALKNLSYAPYNLYLKNPSAYDFYIDLFKKYLPEIQYDYESINKLKTSVYPLIKPHKKSLFTRVVNKFVNMF